MRLIILLVALLLLATDCHATGVYPNLDPDMLLYYHFNNQSEYLENDSYVYDFSGNNNWGNITGNCALNLTGGYLGDGDINFSSWSDKVIINNLNLSEVINFSMLAFVYPKSNTTTQGILTTSDALYNFYHRMNTNARFDWNFPGLSDTYFQTGTTYNTHQWYHLAATYDGIQKTFYVNGVQVDSEAATGLLNMSASLQIGLMPNTGTFTGNIDDVLFVNRSLSGTEVYSRYLDYVNGCNKYSLEDECYIRQDITFLEGDYNFNYTSALYSGGAFNINASDITIDCNNSHIYGNYIPKPLATGTGSGVCFYGWYPVQNVTIKNCNISNYHFGFVDKNNVNSHTYRIHDNKFNNTALAVRFYGGGNHLIYDNSFYNSSNDGVYSGSATFNHNRIYGNYFHGGADGVQIGVYPVSGLYSENNTIYNNTFEYAYSKLGIVLEQTKDCIVENNTFQHRTSPIGSGGGLENVIFRNNIIINVSDQTGQDCSHCKAFNFYQITGMGGYEDMIVEKNSITGANRGMSFINASNLTIRWNNISDINGYGLSIGFERTKSNISNNIFDNIADFQFYGNSSSFSILENNTFINTDAKFKINTAAGQTARMIFNGIYTPYTYFNNINNGIGMLQIRSISNALAYNTNGSVYGSATVSENSAVNATIQGSENAYVFDNFNLTTDTTIDTISQVGFYYSIESEIMDIDTLKLFSNGRYTLANMSITTDNIQFSTGSHATLSLISSTTIYLN